MSEPKNWLTAHPDLPLTPSWDDLLILTTLAPVPRLVYDLLALYSRAPDQMPMRAFYQEFVGSNWYTFIRAINALAAFGLITQEQVGRRRAITVLPASMATADLRQHPSRLRVTPPPAAARCDSHDNLAVVVQSAPSPRYCSQDDRNRISIASSSPSEKKKLYYSVSAGPAAPPRRRGWAARCALIAARCRTSGSARPERSSRIVTQPVVRTEPLAVRNDPSVAVALAAAGVLVRPHAKHATLLDGTRSPSNILELHGTTLDSQQRPRTAPPAGERFSRTSATALRAALPSQPTGVVKPRKTAPREKLRPESARFLAIYAINYQFWHGDPFARFIARGEDYKRANRFTTRFADNLPQLQALADIFLRDYKPEKEWVVKQYGHSLRAFESLLPGMLERDREAIAALTAQYASGALPAYPVPSLAGALQVLPAIQAARRRLLQEDA